MRAIVLTQSGEEDVMQIGDAPSPVMTAGSLRIRVHAAGVNRADLLQRQGHYPPPPGASEILGMECAGEVVEVGEQVLGWEVGDRAMALMGGGGYAEDVVVHAGSAMRIPEALSYEEAGAFPEVFLTAFLNVFELGNVATGEFVLLHGGGSGVGTAATTLCTLSGVRVLVTVGSAEKAALCIAHGAEAAINYKSEDFSKRALELTSGRGVDVVLDNIGATYLRRDLDALAIDGRVLMIGSMGGGGMAEIDVSRLLGRRQQIIGSTLRGKSNDRKTAIVASFLLRFGDELREGNLRPVLARVFPLEQAAEAHRLMKSSEHFGKIVLKVR